MWVPKHGGIGIDCALLLTLHGHVAHVQLRRSAPTMLFFHGNAGNIGYRLPNFIQLWEHSKVCALRAPPRAAGAHPCGLVAWR